MTTQDTYRYGTLADPVTGIPLWNEIWNISDTTSFQNHLQHFIHMRNDIDGHQFVYPGMLEFIERVIIERSRISPTLSMRLTSVLIQHQGVSYVAELIKKHPDKFLEWDIQQSGLSRAKWLSPHWIDVQRTLDPMWLTNTLSKFGDSNFLLTGCLSDIWKMCEHFTMDEKELLLKNVYVSVEESINHKAIDKNPWVHLLLSELQIESRVPNDSKIQDAIDHIFQAYMPHIQVNPHRWLKKQGQTIYHPGSDQLPRLQSRLLKRMLQETKPEDWPWPVKWGIHPLYANERVLEPLGGGTRTSFTSDNVSAAHKHTLVEQALQWDAKTLQQYADLLFYCNTSEDENMHQWCELAKTQEIVKQWSQELWRQSLAIEVPDEDNRGIEVHKRWFQASNTSALDWASNTITQYSNASEKELRNLYIRMLYVCGKSPDPERNMVQNIVCWCIQKTHPHIGMDQICNWMDAMNAIHSDFHEVPISDLLNTWLTQLQPLDMEFEHLPPSSMV